MRKLPISKQIAPKEKNNNLSFIELRGFSMAILATEEITDQAPSRIALDRLYFIQSVPYICFFGGLTSLPSSLATFFLASEKSSVAAP